MRAVRSKDTAPEIIVRRLVHSFGFRFRLHYPSLPGKPDLAFPGLRKVIFVHGCFWHWHDCGRGRRLPKTRSEYWKNKLEGNRARDRRHRLRLQRMGWRSLVVWECEVRPQYIELVADRLLAFLDSS